MMFHKARSSFLAWRRKGRLIIGPYDDVWSTDQKLSKFDEGQLPLISSFSSCLAKAKASTHSRILVCARALNDLFVLFKKFEGSNPQDQKVHSVMKAGY